MAGVWMVVALDTAIPLAIAFRIGLRVKSDFAMCED
ncbi:hypothetical protein WN51_04118 [Melipona quadrifasciata]|uniref:Uncharacterized protein n=1 Tax=Melipona quadrifasciata TaxID=166423 RepID=A0A0N0U3H0_9HYME|nr:hypothetical protein WN51_04118 [Melipona quadrifasciata]